MRRMSIDDKGCSPEALSDEIKQLRAQRDEYIRYDNKTTRKFMLLILGGILLVLLGACLFLWIFNLPKDSEIRRDSSLLMLSYGVSGVIIFIGMFAVAPTLYFLLSLRRTKRVILKNYEDQENIAKGLDENNLLIHKILRSQGLDPKKVEAQVRKELQSKRQGETQNLQDLKSDCSESEDRG
jgi:hypothetical protein